MAYPPDFLDELRDRIALSAVVGATVKLARRGREQLGLCPFHAEKTPSFTVSDDKGFYHCFGCGAHGDAIGYVMHAEGLSFPEAVERLAAAAGLAVPRTTPAERERADARATIHAAVEAACVWFQEQLEGADGRAARAYLAERELDGETIARFRLGWSPERRTALKDALMSETLPEALLVEAGMLIRPEDGGSYDRFRGRVMFPICDRRGRTIAFGGRTLGDHPAKYINSPDTPLFNKGRVLYGLAQAREAAREAGRIVVVEGYMDAIALSQAGIREVVAPLGTALTEAQMVELWRLAPEPTLCFDGDAAGSRAAARAAARALPLLQPGRSLRFAVVPPGDDPDSLVRRRGAGAVEGLLAAAKPLDQVIWEIETAGRDFATPERRAGLEARLDDRVGAIAERKVQFQYRMAFRERLRRDFAPVKWRGGAGAPLGRAAPGQAMPGLVARGDPGSLDRRQQQGMLQALINHPALLDELAETLAQSVLPDPTLDRLRQEILKVYAASSALDSADLKRQLRERGFAHPLDALYAPEVRVHDAYARPDQPLERARAGLMQVMAGFHYAAGQAQLDEAQRMYNADPTIENWTRWQHLIEARQREKADMASLDDDSIGIDRSIPT